MSRVYWNRARRKYLPSSSRAAGVREMTPQCIQSSRAKGARQDDNVQELATLEAQVKKMKAVEQAWNDFMEYRKHNTLNFQLEKADSYFHVINVAIEQIKL